MIPQARKQRQLARIVSFDGSDIVLTEEPPKKSMGKRFKGGNEKSQSSETLFATGRTWTLHTLFAWVCDQGGGWRWNRDELAPLPRSRLNNPQLRQEDNMSSRPHGEDGEAETTFQVLA